MSDTRLPIAVNIQLISSDTTFLTKDGLRSMIHNGPFPNELCRGVNLNSYFKNDVDAFMIHIEDALMYLTNDFGVSLMKEMQNTATTMKKKTDYSCNLTRTNFQAFVGKIKTFSKQHRMMAHVESFYSTENVEEWTTYPKMKRAPQAIIGIHLGKSMSIRINSFKEDTPLNDHNLSLKLSHGDMYILDRNACGVTCKGMRFKRCLRFTKSSWDVVPPSPAKHGNGIRQAWVNQLKESRKRSIRDFAKEEAAQKKQRLDEDYNYDSILDDCFQEDDPKEEYWEAFNRQLDEEYDRLVNGY